MGELGKISFWDWLPFREWRVVCAVEAADEIPTKLPKNGAVLVGSHKHPKWLAFDCPCRTGHRIMVTLDPKHRPHWRIGKDKKLTLSPSVDFRTQEKRCHYIIRNGKLIWVR